MNKFIIGAKKTNRLGIGYVLCDADTIDVDLAGLVGLSFMTTLHYREQDGYYGEFYNEGRMVMYPKYPITLYKPTDISGIDHWEKLTIENLKKSCVYFEQFYYKQYIAYVALPYITIGELYNMTNKHLYNTAVHISGMTEGSSFTHHAPF